ncbi:MAG: hypothetical protein QOD44_810 [Solirubrobacteraceae bacterium]|jgi:hypothetical protein|nr:hypothetical protein [Solirubrobacteraceae bacterium]MEA2316621.1 hypothetical protein [Solirubrobacteraceae bacterium]
MADLQGTNGGDGAAAPKVPEPVVVALADTPITPADSWPENLDVANMITKGRHGSEILLGAAWMEAGQRCNPWSFKEEDPGIEDVTHYGITHETYFVISGRLHLSWDGGELEAGPDDAVYLAPGYDYELRCIEKSYFLWSMSPPPA